jgi:hypothetical protein
MCKDDACAFEAQQEVQLPELTIFAPEFRPDKMHKFSVMLTIASNRIASDLTEGESELRGEFSVRGYSSRQHPKKPFKLEVQDALGEDLKVSLLGMPNESDWILFPSYTDKTLVRNVLGMELWRRMGHYAPRWRFVEVYIVTNRQLSAVSGRLPDYAARQEPRLPDVDSEYQGIYVLMEKIKRGKERVNVQKLRKEDAAEPNISGGYIFKKDRLNEGEEGFRSSKRIPFAYEEPKERDITSTQCQWLTNFVNEFEQVLFSENFRDLENGYAKYIDVDSFIDYHWMVEATKNIDGYWFSQFFHKERGGKLKAGPVWDWDLSFGNCFYHEGFKTNGWRCDAMQGFHYKWYARLFEDPDFVQKYIDRWAELRTNVFATSNLLAFVDKYSNELVQSGAIERNYKRWPTLGQFVHPNRFIGNTYEEEINWLKKWIEGRLTWIDSQDFPKPTLTVAPKENALLSTAGFPGTQELRMACAVGNIFYTTDGSDPRLRGGDISPNAKEYKTPLPIEPGLNIKARVRSEYGLWSAPTVWP